MPELPAPNARHRTTSSTRFCRVLPPVNEAKWGPQASHIRLNTELVKKPKDLLEYVVVHEMAHLLEPTHSERFIAILEAPYPPWREARAALNQLPRTPEALT